MNDDTEINDENQNDETSDSDEPPPSGNLMKQTKPPLVLTVAVERSTDEKGQSR